MTTLPEFDLKKIKTLEDALVLIQELVMLNRQLFEENQSLRAEVEKLKAEVTRLKHLPKKPTFPTSSDYSATKAASQHLGKTKKSWHKSAKKGVIPVDREVNLPEAETCECGSTQFRILRSRQRLVQGIIIKRDNVLYRGNDKRCKQCGKIHNLVIPTEIANQEFSPELRTWVSDWKFDCRFTEPLIHNFCSSLGIQISTGQISRIILTNSQKLIPAYTHLRIWGIKVSRYLHTDATGFKRYLQQSSRVIRQHLHFVGHGLLSLFKITRRYNTNQMAFKVLGKRGMSKAMISDDHSANRDKLPVKVKQLCWLHEIRHYIRLLPLILKHRKAVAEILNEWWLLYEMAKHYKRGPTLEERLTLEAGFARLTSMETGYGDLDACLKRSQKKEKRLLAFLDRPELPIENNLAERDIRVAVLIRQISGMTKSEAGDRSLERHLSVIQTARKQGLDVFTTLHGLLNDQLSPFVLTSKTFASAPQY